MMLVHCQCVLNPLGHSLFRAGLLGICGNNDLRSVIAMRDKGDAKGKLALDMFVYRCIRVYVCACVCLFTP